MDPLPGSDRFRDFAERYTVASCSQDPKRVASFFAPNGSLAINGGKAAVGREAITAVAQSFMEAFPDLHLDMEDLRIRDGLPEFHWTLTGTNTGPGGDGKRVRISGWEVWEIGGDGLIDESKGHFDEEDYLRQLSGF
jgi:predicted ester cyclase